MASNVLTTQIKWMKAYGATDIVTTYAEDESVDDSVDFVLDGFECALQVSPYSGTVVAWNTYERNDQGDIVSGFTFLSMAEFIKHVNPIKGRR